MGVPHKQHARVAVVEKERGGKECSAEERDLPIGGSPAVMPHLAYDDTWDAASHLAAAPQ